MTYIQLVEPNINISARPAMCLEYVDNAINAPQRTINAQVAHDIAKSKGWVTADQNYPRDMWFVMFWSIDNGPYIEQGHVALAYVGSDGSLQIHDSEVHRGARQPYTSLAEFAGWFGSVGTRLTYLGWSIGVDGRQIIEDYTPKQSVPTGEKPKTKKKKGEFMILFKEADGKVYWLIGNKYTYVSNPTDLGKIQKLMDKAGYDTWIHTDARQIEYLKRLAQKA